MAGTFSILLTLATFITGIFWCLEKFKFKPARQRKIEAVRQQSEGEIDRDILANLDKPHRIVELFSSFFSVLFIVFVIRSFIVEPFQIPSGSMMPNLLVGDFIVVQKFSYGIKDPITNTTIIPTGKPQRGDVAVFKDPKNPSRDLVKRVIGLPGDKIVYLVNEKVLQIYPACQDSQCHGQEETPLNLNYGTVTESAWIEVIRRAQLNFYTENEYQNFYSTHDSSTFSSERLYKRQENLNGHSYDLLLLPMTAYGEESYYRQQGQKAGEWLVPKGHYFMMGDNRDNSDDSRFWGFVPEENLVGRAVFIWLSLDKQPNEWPTGIRFEQMGYIN